MPYKWKRKGVEEGADAPANGQSMARANFGRKKIQKYRWLEHSIIGRSMAGAFRKWLGNLEKGTYEKIR